MQGQDVMRAICRGLEEEEEDDAEKRNVKPA